MPQDIGVKVTHCRKSKFAKDSVGNVQVERWNGFRVVPLDVLDIYGL